MSSIFFEHIQIFLSVVKSDILPYKLAYLNNGQKYLTTFKYIESGQKILNAANFVFELADGLGIIHKMSKVAE